MARGRKPMIKKIEEALCFDDVLLRPNHFRGKSRSRIDLGTKIAGLTLELPIISSNMPTIASLEMALVMNACGGMAILDRMSEDQAIRIGKVRARKPKGLIGASIGIGKSALDDAKRLVEAGANLICIDIAHGDQPRTYQVAQQFRKAFPTHPLMIGNFAYPDEASEWFRDLDASPEHTVFKLGVGSGAVCTTRIQTGCGLPTFQSILDFQEHSPGISVIADGGIKNSGDIVKSLAAGASAVMIGSLLAGTNEALGEFVELEGATYKRYRGNASEYTKRAASMKHKHIEGVETFVLGVGGAGAVISGLEDGIRSGFSYCGAENLDELQCRSVFYKTSSSGHHESKPHATFR
jgi:IMP dehydrogenase/GMP reductase